MVDSDTENTSSSPAKRRRTSRISVLNEEFDLSLLILIAQKKWKLLAAIIVLSIIGAIIYLRYIPRIYEENCVMQIGSQNTANKVLNNPNGGLYQNNENEAAEAVEFMGSKVFLQKVFKTLPMAVSYYKEGTFKNYERYLTSPYSVDLDSNAEHNLKNSKVYVKFNSANSGKLSLNKAVNSKNSINFINGEWCNIPPLGKIKITIIYPSEIESYTNGLSKDVDFFQVNDYNDITKYYYDKIQVKIINPDAKTIQISCNDFDDKKAADIVNTIGKLYIAEILEKRKKSAEQILKFVDNELDTIYLKIKGAEGIIDSNKKQEGFNNPLSFRDIRAATTIQLSTLNDQIFKLESTQNILTDAENQINKSNDIDPMQLVIQLDGIDLGANGMLKGSLDKLSQLINRRDLALNDITTDNKTIIEVNNQIKNQKDLIIQSLESLNNKIATSLELLKNKRADIYTAEMHSDTGTNMEYMRMQRELKINEKYYDDLLDKKAEYAISKAGYVPESQVLDFAFPDWMPVSPKKSVVLLVSLLIALTLSIVVLIFVYLFYNNITSVEEIERLIENPVTILGIIPKYTKEIPLTQIIVNHNPKSILAESFRSIRTNLQFITNDTKAKIIAITSTISGEGKTFVSVNLGGIIAYSGKRVIILDLDMRRPRIHTSFGLDNSKGMSTLLIGKYSIEEVIQKSETENLHIITAGPIPPNPSELVISAAMDEILNKLKTIYDVIIVDNPPVGLVTDGIAMLRKADYPIYLMRADYSKREFIYFIDRLYYENQFRSLSIILNGVDFARQKYGYSYYKYGYYGYGYGHTYGHGNYYET